MVEYLNPNTLTAVHSDENAPTYGRAATGYGPKIPTRYRMTTDDGRTRRVYVMAYGNSGSAYIVMAGTDTFLPPGIESLLEDLAPGATRYLYPIDDASAAQLMATLLWQATTGEDGVSMDSLYDVSDIATADRNRFVDDFRQFCGANARDVAAFMAHTGRTLDDVAHDYVLTRNHHGTGFWDRCYCGRGNDDAPARRLTDAAHAEGEADLYVGDDGFLHVD